MIITDGPSCNRYFRFRFLAKFDFFALGSFGALGSPGALGRSEAPVAPAGGDPVKLSTMSFWLLVMFSDPKLPLPPTAVARCLVAPLAEDV